MPRLIRNEHELFIVFFVLLRKLAEENKKGNIVVFPPEKVILPDGIVQDEKWFSGKGRLTLKIAKKDINFSFEAEIRTDMDISEAMRQLGITLYHLAAGKSELTRESFWIDGYRAPFEGADWPFILAMIRGEVKNIKDVFMIFRNYHRGDSSAEKNSDKATETKVPEKPPIISQYANSIADWQNFYRDIFGIEPSFIGLRIPEKPKKGQWRLLIIIDLLLEVLYDKCKSLFPCWRWTENNLDEIVTENERTAKNGPYAIWVKDKIEADEEFKNQSADNIKAKNLKTETFAERFIHELKFFKETTGGHLDEENITLCSGSRYSDGVVPLVSWHDSKVDVSWCHPGNADDDLRSRQVVSLT